MIEQVIDPILYQMLPLLYKLNCMTEFDKIYKNIISEIYNEWFEELNERTWYKTKIKTWIHFNLRVENFPVLTLRKIPLKLFIAEQIWYLQWTKELDFFQKFSKIWDDFKEDNNTVESWYWYRWRKFFQRDQVKSLIEMLENEPSSRQWVVITWDPNTDWLASKKKKNTPCVPIWVANIVNGELNFHVVFRSSDVMLWLPHDVAWFSLVQHILAQKIWVKVWWLHFTISHAHIYENHYIQAEELIKRNHEHPEIKLQLPENTFDKIFEEWEKLVNEIFENINSQYKPLPSLWKMQIAL
jgi:thymidylate synthase